MVEIKILDNTYLIDVKEIIFIKHSECELDIKFKNGHEVSLSNGIDDFLKMVDDIKNAYNEIKKEL